MENKKKRNEELLQEAKNFLNANRKAIGESIRTGERVVIINFTSITEYSPDLAEAILETPEPIIVLLEQAMDELGFIKDPRARFINLPKTAKTKVREIRAKHLDQLIEIEGIVRQTSEVRPQVINARFECPTCGAILSVLQIDRKFLEPNRCTCGWKGQFKLLSKEMVDTQRVVIEEAPDSLEGGQQPRRLTIFLKEDLVDPRMEERTTPGSRVKIYGILKEVPVPLQTGSISTRFDIAMDANNIIPLEETFDDLNVSDDEIKEILEIAADPHLIKRLSNSIAPSIYGFSNIKEAVLLQLFGGVKKVKSDGGSTRGDIHILLVGDPGVAKSVLLKFTSNIAPKGRYVSGKAASAAGLTAAVIKDEFLKGWSLEAGAMVLANKGMVCIDEIEKMTEQDRSAMHEAMEQQCYHYDTIITLSNGKEIKIGKLVEELLEKNKEKIIQGKDCLILPNSDIEVLTTDFKSIFPTKVDRISKHRAFNKFIKIKFSHGREIIVTPEHPVFTAENGQIITKRADEIKIGASVPIPLFMPITGKTQIFNTSSIYNSRATNHIKIPETNSSELYKILGYIISEGSKERNRGKSIGINFTNKDMRLLNEFEELMKKEFNIVPYKQVRIDKNGECWCYRYTSTELANFLKINAPEILNLANKKEIPSWAMQAKTEDIAKMLSTLFEGDGYASVKDRTIRIGYKTASKRLAEQIQDLLLRLKIRSSITNDREYFRVGITSYDNLQNFNKFIGFITPEKNQIVEKYLKEKTTRRTYKDKIPFSFNSSIINIIKEENITQIGKYKTYDIIYDHQTRKDTFSFSRHFLIALAQQLKSEKNKQYTQQFIEDIGWEKIAGIEIIENENEEWVYDITIEPNHAFISQASILHNTVTISKANIHATLRAETTVLAAGNPKMGRFDPFTPIHQQIDISPALLSRFDALFIIRDLPNKVQDEAIASHVLQEHQQEVIRDVIEPMLFRKYIAYTKKIKPKLTDEAVEEIKTFYVRMRTQSTKSDSAVKPIPITARQLEGIIRLSEAHAKMRLSKEVKKIDAQKAIEIIKMCLSQVGYDEESKSFDIDKIMTGMSTSKRSKVILVKEAITHLESKLGKLIPVEDLQKELEGKVSLVELEDAISQLSRQGDLFKPKSGYIQRV
ncbi:MAG: LAGLIDADG family homing endonuclease [Nanoarchaeota archaeon]